MALIDCPTCGQQMAVSARRCPDCGALSHSHTRRQLVIVAAVLIVAVTLFLFFYLMG